MKADISKSGFKPNQDRFFQADGFQTWFLENKQDAWFSIQQWSCNEKAAFVIKPQNLDFCIRIFWFCKSSFSCNYMI